MDKSTPRTPLKVAKRKATNRRAPATKVGVGASNRTRAETSPSALIDARIAALGDWRSETLAQVRAIILSAHPGIDETVKWRKPSNPAGVPVWEHGGLICTGETYRDKIKLTFAKGAALDDPSGLFNASLDAGTRRAIDIHEGDRIDAKALKALVKAAAKLNAAG